MLTTIKEWIKTVGIYRHLKTRGLYLVVGWGWESTNNRPRERIVAYFSFKNRTLNFRTWDEFFETNIFDMVKLPLSKPFISKNECGTKSHTELNAMCRLSHRFKKVLGFGKQPVVTESLLYQQYKEYKLNSPPRCTSCHLFLRLPPTMDCKTPTAHSWKKEI